MNFKDLNLNASLLKALADLELEYPTPIQQECFPVAMSGKDIIGIAQTGTGKTFAYLLPILRMLPFSEQRDPRVLILVPTRELVVQVVEEIRKLTTYFTVRVVGVYGGTNINTQKDLLYGGLDILVATPGRLVDLAMTGILRLKSIQKLVIDEVDEMLNLGFRPQLLAVMELLPEKRQNLMFSATLTEEVEALIQDYFAETVRVEVIPQGTPLAQIDQYLYFVPNFYSKVNLLEVLLSTDSALEKVLVFVSTKKSADRLYEILEAKFPGLVGVLHSNKSQNYRLNALSRFSNGEFRILISTDVMARGLDITDVSHVINLDMPQTPGDYINRIGRTGRADKSGVAISFVAEYEMDYLESAETYMQTEIYVEDLPEGFVASTKLTDDEQPANKFDKSYLRTSKITDLRGAYHEKKNKNKKVNLGGPGRKARLAARGKKVDGVQDPKPRPPKIRF